MSSRVCLGPTPVPEVCFSCQAAVSNVMFQTQRGGGGGGPGGGGPGGG